MKLLHIIASPRGNQSRTLSISSSFLEALQEHQPELQVDELNVFEADLPLIASAEADSKYAVLRGQTVDTSVQEFWDAASGMAQDFKAYDKYLLTVPMWNFSIPYALKHYIDLIIQPGIMFQYTATGVEGLLEGKKMVCITSRGADYGPESPMNSLDNVEQYLRAIFGFIGIVDISFINAQALDFTPEVTEQSMQYARHSARELVPSF